MRRAFTLIEVLVVITVLPFVMVIISGVYATFIRDLPQTTRILQENTIVLDLLGQIRRDVDGAVGLPPQFEGHRADARTLLIAQPGQVIRYGIEDGRIARTVLVGGIAKASGLDDGPTPVPAAIARGGALDAATQTDSDRPTTVDGPLSQERIWRMRDAVIAWRLWEDGDRAYAVEVHSHVKQRIAGHLREKLANSHVFFLRGSGLSRVARPPSAREFDSRGNAEASHQWDSSGSVLPRRLLGALPPNPRHFALGANSMAGATRGSVSMRKRTTSTKEMACMANPTVRVSPCSPIMLLAPSGKCRGSGGRAPGRWAVLNSRVCNGWMSRSLETLVKEGQV